MTHSTPPSDPNEPPTGTPPPPAYPPQGYGYPPPGHQYPPQGYPPQGYLPQQYGQPVRAASGMYTAAAVINWVIMGMIIVFTLGIGIIVAAWFIPMTIAIHKGAKDGYKHTALGVCTLLFCNIISGILILIDDSNRPARLN